MARVRERPERCHPSGRGDTPGLVLSGDEVVREDDPARKVPDVDVVPGPEIEQRQVVELTGEQVLVDGATAHPEEVVFDAVPVVVAMQGVEVARDDGIHARLHQLRVHLEPVDVRYPRAADA